MPTSGFRHPQLTVQPHRPWRRAGLILAFVCAAALAIWQAYMLGIKKGGFSSAVADTEFRSANEQIEYLLARSSELVEQNAVWRQAAEVERVAREEIRNSLLAAEQEVAELRQELVFYRNLMSPGDNRAGLHIEAVSLVEELLPNTYRYELVLTQVRGKDKYARGQLLLKLFGSVAGEPKTLTLADVTPDQDTGTRFRFKYFQSLSGLMELPPGFTPESLEFEAVSSVKGLESVSRSFPWQELIAGGIETNVGQD